MPAADVDSALELLIACTAGGGATKKRPSRRLLDAGLAEQVGRGRWRLTEAGARAAAGERRGPTQVARPEAEEPQVERGAEPPAGRLVRLPANDEFRVAAYATEGLLQALGLGAEEPIRLADLARAMLPRLARAGGASRVEFFVPRPGARPLSACARACEVEGERAVVACTRHELPGGSL